MPIGALLDSDNSVRIIWPGQMTAPAYTSFTRSGNASLWSSSALLTEVASDILRADHDPALAVTNLVTRSERINNWTLNASATVRANVELAPNATMTADVVDMAAGGSSGVYRSGVPAIAGQPYTYSVYVKYISGVNQRLRIGSDSTLVFGNSTNGVTTYNWDSNTFSGSGLQVTATSAVEAGLGWRRISVTLVPTATNAAAFIVYNTVTATAVASWAVWGAMVNIGSVAEFYIPTEETAQSVAPWRGFLLEEPRTNVIIQSADIALAFNSNTNTTVTADQTLAPNNTTTGDLISRPSSPGFRQRASVGTLGDTEIFSQFVKGDGTGGLWGMRIQGTFPNRVDAVFNLAAGTVVHNSANTWTSPTAGIIPVGNGWYRCWVSAVSATSARSSYVCGPTTLATNGWESSGGAASAFVWGSQGEVGTNAYPSSYIATLGSAVTRNRDNWVSNLLAAFGFDAVKGTIYVEYEVMGVPVGRTQRAVFLDNGTSDNRITLGTFGSGAFYTVRTATVDQVALNTGTVAALTTIRQSGAYQLNNFAGSVNGAAALTDSSGTVPTGIAWLRIGQEIGPTNSLNGWLKKLVFYPDRLPNAQLPSLNG